MRITNNLIKEIKSIGHDRFVIHSTGVYSCFVTEDTKFGDKGTKMQNCAIIQGARNIVMLGDVYLTAPYALVDLKLEKKKDGNN